MVRLPSRAPRPKWRPLVLDEHQNQAVAILPERVSRPRRRRCQGSAGQPAPRLPLNESPKDKKAGFIAGLTWLRSHGRRLRFKCGVANGARSGSGSRQAQSENEPRARLFERLNDVTIFKYYTSRTGLEQDNGEGDLAKSRGPATIPSTYETEVMSLMKTLLRQLTTVAALCLACTALALAADAPDGAAIFKSKCSMCHGQDGKGYAAVKTPDFTDPKWQASITDQKIADTIKNGKQGTMMMPFGTQLKDAEIAALVKQIRSFGKK